MVVSILRGATCSEFAELSTRSSTARWLILVPRIFKKMSVLKFVDIGAGVATFSVSHTLVIVVRLLGISTFMSCFARIFCSYWPQGA